MIGMDILQPLVVLMIWTMIVWVWMYATRIPAMQAHKDIDTAKLVGGTGKDLDSLLPACDFLTVHTPLTEQTRGLINAERLALMKSSALLINTARGGLIDEAALVTALNEGQIAGAALDTLSVEPPPADHPLLQLDLPNLLLTPHSAWSAKEARQRLVQIAAERLQGFIEGC